MTNQRYCVDSGVFITSWNISYPIRMFPEVWSELEAKKDQLLIIKPMFDEIDPPSASDLTSAELRQKHPLHDWVKNRFNPLLLNDEVEALAFELRERYNTQKTGKGAGEKDISLIAYAKQHGLPLVTLESQQRDRPKKKQKYKIPLICQDEGVVFLNHLVELLDELGFRK